MADPMNPPAGAPAGAAPAATPPAVAPAGTPAATTQAEAPETLSRSKAFEAAEFHKAEAAAAKAEAAKLKADLKAIEDKKLADEGNFREIAKREEEARKAVEAELASERSKVKEAARHNELLLEGQKMDLKRPEIYLKLVDPSLPPKEALAALKASVPEAFGPVDAKTNNTKVATAPAAGKPFDPTTPKTPAEIREMSPDQFNAYMAAKHGKSLGGKPFLG